jgi:hypothetical protein
VDGDGTDTPARTDRRRRAPFDPSLLVGSTDAEILQDFVGLVRNWRGLQQRRGLQLREADVAVLVAILGTDSAEVERRLVAATACSPRLARHSRRLLLASVGVLALGLVSAPHIGGAAPAAQQAMARRSPDFAAVAEVRSTTFRGSPDQIDRASQVDPPADVASAVPLEDPTALHAEQGVEAVENTDNATSTQAAVRRVRKRS